MNHAQALEVIAPLRNGEYRHITVTLAYTLCGRRVNAQWTEATGPALNWPMCQKCDRLWRKRTDGTP